MITYYSSNVERVYSRYRDPIAQDRCLNEEDVSEVTFVDFRDSVINQFGTIRRLCFPSKYTEAKNWMVYHGFPNHDRKIHSKIGPAIQAIGSLLLILDSTSVLRDETIMYLDIQACRD